MFDTASLAMDSQAVRRLTGLLIWIGGAATTAAGAWVTSRIRVYHDDRKAHLEDIKSKVLVPIRDGFQSFRPFVFHLVPVVTVDYGPKHFREDASVTEAPFQSGPILTAAFPGQSVFSSAESALLEDARRTCVGSA